MSARLLVAPLAVALLAASGGCGGEGEDLIEESSLQDCLAERGLAIERPNLAASAALGSVSPDFRAVSEGTAVDLVVQGSERKAERSAADISAGLQGLGAAGAEVVVERNAIAVFARAPSPSLRASVEECLV
jgi:hypothetical protein